MADNSDLQSQGTPVPAASPPSARRLSALEAVLFVVVLALLVAVVIPPRAIDFSSGGGRSPVSRVKSDMRSVATAIEAYYVDENIYPLSASGELGVNSAAPRDSRAFSVMTFRQHRFAEDYASLTSPVAYMTSYPIDMFSDLPRATFGYYTDLHLPSENNSGSSGWILFSPGLDGDYDIVPHEDYDSRIIQPSDALRLKEYDPTNGTVSGGDIYRVKQ